MQGERTARADSALAVRPAQSVLFGVGVGLFDSPHQKIELLDGGMPTVFLNALAFFDMIL